MSDRPAGSSPSTNAMMCSSVTCRSPGGRSHVDSLVMKRASQTHDGSLDQFSHARHANTEDSRNLAIAEPLGSQMQALTLLGGEVRHAGFQSFHPLSHQVEL